MLLKSEPVDAVRELSADLLGASNGKHKVVVHLVSGDVIRGYLELDDDCDLADFFAAASRDTAGEIALRPLGSNNLLEIGIHNAKAVFVVRSFGGDPNRRDLRFYSNGPAVTHVWVEIQFNDNEVIEGLIENSAQHILEDGFTVKPSDRGGNNVLVYVNKAAIKNYRVLGIKSPVVESK